MTCFASGYPRKGYEKGGSLGLMGRCDVGWSCKARVQRTRSTVAWRSTRRYINSALAGNSSIISAELLRRSRKITNTLRLTPEVLGDVLGREAVLSSETFRRQRDIMIGRTQKSSTNAGTSLLPLESGNRETFHVCASQSGS